MPATGCVAAALETFTMRPQFRAAICGSASRVQRKGPVTFTSKTRCHPAGSMAATGRSEEHTSELQSHRDLHSFPTRRSSDLPGGHLRQRLTGAEEGAGDVHLEDALPPGGIHGRDR